MSKERVRSDLRRLKNRLQLRRRAPQKPRTLLPNSRTPGGVFRCADPAGGRSDLRVSRRRDEAFDLDTEEEEEEEEAGAVDDRLLPQSPEVGF